MTFIFISINAFRSSAVLWITDFFFFNCITGRQDSVNHFVPSRSRTYTCKAQAQDLQGKLPGHSQTEHSFLKMKQLALTRTKLPSIFSGFMKDGAVIFNPYMPSVPKMGHRQTGQNQCSAASDQGLQCLLSKQNKMKKYTRRP